MILRFRSSKVLSYGIKIKVLKTVSLGGVITGVQKTRGKDQRKNQREPETIKTTFKSKTAFKIKTTFNSKRSKKP